MGLLIPHSTAGDAVAIGKQFYVKISKSSDNAGKIHNITQFLCLHSTRCQWKLRGQVN